MPLESIIGTSGSRISACPPSHSIIDHLIRPPVPSRKRRESVRPEASRKFTNVDFHRAPRGPIHVSAKVPRHHIAQAEGDLLDCPLSYGSGREFASAPPYHSATWTAALGRGEQGFADGFFLTQNQRSWALRARARARCPVAGGRRKKEAGANDASPEEKLLTYRCCHPPAWCRTAKLLPPLDQTSTRASCPLGTLLSAFLDIGRTCSIGLRSTSRITSPDCNPALSAGLPRLHLLDHRAMQMSGALGVALVSGVMSDTPTPQRGLPVPASGNPSLPDLSRLPFESDWHRNTLAIAHDLQLDPAAIFLSDHDLQITRIAHFGVDLGDPRCRSQSRRRDHPGRRQRSERCE